MNVEDRVKFFREMRTADSFHGETLRKVMEEGEDVVIEMIRLTTLNPLYKPQRGKVFDHQLENFIFCLNEAEVYKFPKITKALFEKIVQETPEYYFYEMDFLSEFIERSQEWETFARFIFNDLFGSPKVGYLEPRKIINSLVSTNGRWESNELPKEAFLTHEESQRVIDKIREIFFNF